MLQNTLKKKLFIAEPVSCSLHPHVGQQSLLICVPPFDMDLTSKSQIQLTHLIMLEEKLKVLGATKVF